MPETYALEPVLVLGVTLMDMSRPMGKMPRAVPKPHIPESGPTIEEQVFEMQRQAVVELITEIVKTTDIVGQDADGKTWYVMRLSPTSSDTLAALFADLEDGDPLDEGEYDPLDKGEEEHDGREPDPEDAT